MAIVSTLDTDMDDAIRLSATSLRKIGRRMADAAAVRLMNQQQQVEPLLYATSTTTVHLPYGNGRYWRHLLRLDLGHPASSSWLLNEDARRVMGFTIYDTKLSTQLDIIYSARINKDNQIDLYLTDDGYQQLVGHVERFVLWYGYGKNPQCNLVTTYNQAALAFGPLSINVTLV